MLRQMAEVRMSGHCGCGHRPHDNRKSRQPRPKAEWRRDKKIGQERSAGSGRPLPQSDSLSLSAFYVGGPLGLAPQSRQPHVNLRSGTAHHSLLLDHRVHNRLIPDANYYRYDRSDGQDGVPAVELVEDN